MATCTAMRRDGTPCTARALPNDVMCFAHSATTAQKRQQAYAAGGKGRASAARVRRLVPTTLRPLLEQILDAVVEVHEGDLTPGQATAMATLANAAARLFEQAEFTARLERLEEMSNGQGRTGYPH